MLTHKWRGGGRSAIRRYAARAFPTPNCRTAEELHDWLGRIAAGCADAPGLWAANLVTHSTNPRLPDDLALEPSFA